MKVLRSSIGSSSEYFLLTGQGLEDAGGRAIALDHDIFGSRRAGDHPAAGPLESSRDGLNTIKIHTGVSLL